MVSGRRPLYSPQYVAGFRNALAEARGDLTELHHRHLIDHHRHLAELQQLRHEVAELREILAIVVSVARIGTRRSPIPTSMTDRRARFMRGTGSDYYPSSPNAAALPSSSRPPTARPSSRRPPARPQRP